MAKRLRHGTQGQKRQGMMSGRTHMSYSTAWKGTPGEDLSHKQLERVFELVPDSILVYDKDEKIIWINAQARLLFEVTSTDCWNGKSREQFLQEYRPSELRQRSTTALPWLMNLIRNDEAGTTLSGQTLMLSLSSGRSVYVHHWLVPLFDERQHTHESFSVFRNITYCYQKILHLQRVHEATLALTNAIACWPVHIDLTFSKEMPLISPLVIFVAQQLVDLIRRVLRCCRVLLCAFGPSGHTYHVAGSGLTPEEEQYWQDMRGRVLPTEFVDETVLVRLSTHQEVVLPAHDVHIPDPPRPADSTENCLLIPLFLAQQWVGVLTTVKADAASDYTREEVELVKAVAAQTMLIIQCLLHLNQEIEGQTRVLIQYEIHRLIDDFLTLAGHELLTPLTTIFGNIQLAQRRLEALNRCVAAQPERVYKCVEHVQRPLASAFERATLQKRMINDLIDDAQIQTNHFKLHMGHTDLHTLLKEAVFKLQRSVPQSAIILKIPSEVQRVPIFADAERITRILNTYLGNALNHSPHKAPVTVQLVVADSQALVSVHDEGPGIPQDVQEHLWERFYRAKGSAVQHELDLSLGLGFYLCRVIIEHHHGHVGVQSNPGKGETFWFTLPLVADPEQ